MSVTEVKLKYKLNISQEKKCQCRLGLGTHWYKQKRQRNASVVVKTTNLRKKIFDSFHRLKFYLEWKDINHRYFKKFFIRFLKIRGQCSFEICTPHLKSSISPLHPQLSILNPWSSIHQSWKFWRLRMKFPVDTVNLLLQ